MIQECSQGIETEAHGVKQKRVRQLKGLIDVGICAVDA
jgi:hypothetical protein